jgi:hypothetical protein
MTYRRLVTADSQMTRGTGPMDAYAAQLRRQMDATCAAMAATLTRILIRVAHLGCRGTWELWTGLTGAL